MREEDHELRGRKGFGQVLLGLTPKLGALVKHFMKRPDDGESTETARSRSLTSGEKSLKALKAGAAGAEQSRAGGILQVLVPARGARGPCFHRYVCH